MCAESRTPQSVTSAATSQERDVSVGEKSQYTHTSSTKPRPQQASAILASRSLTLSIHASAKRISTMPSPASAANMAVTSAHAERSRAASRRIPPHELVRAVPVNQPRQSNRFEYGGLVDDGSAGSRLNFEPEPRATGHFHFSGEAEAASRFVTRQPARSRPYRQQSRALGSRRPRRMPTPPINRSTAPLIRHNHVA